MTRAEFLHELERALELDSGALTSSLKLSDTEAWDSMAGLIFMSLTEEKLGVTLTGDQLADCRTVGDLLALVENHLTE